MENSKAPKQANSMVILTAMGTQLVSAKTAVEFVKMFTLDRYGRAEWDANQPLGPA